MASFLVETHVAQGGREQFANAVVELRAAFAAIATPDVNARHVRSYLVPSDEMGLHLIEADSVDVVMQGTKLAGIEVERVVSAISVEPAPPRRARSGSGGAAPDPGKRRPVR